MDFQELINSQGMYLASLIVGGVGGIIPLVNVELFLLAVIPLVNATSLLPIALLAALGQMIAKYILYHTGIGFVALNKEKHRRRLQAAQEKIKKWQDKALSLVFFSSITGVPPFYAVSIAAGTLKLELLRFLALGMLGRSIRFVAIVYFVDWFF